MDDDYFVGDLLDDFALCKDDDTKDLYAFKFYALLDDEDNDYFVVDLLDVFALCKDDEKDFYAFKLYALLDNER